MITILYDLFKSITRMLCNAMAERRLKNLMLFFIKLYDDN